MELQENVPLAPLTTLGVGGRARFFVKAQDIQSVEEAVAFARSLPLPLFVLGGGSNVVISDQGWEGLVLRIGVLGITESTCYERTCFSVGAGEDWDGLVAHTVSLGYAGLECLSGIPGSVGGTPVQNVGAYGQEVSQTIVSVLAFDLQQSQIRELTVADCGFSYRASIFNTTQRGRYIILRVTFGLAPEGSPSMRYADLQKYFAHQDRAPTLSEVREAVRAIRASKGMLISRGDPDSHSAGSFFKNPVLTDARYEDLRRRAAERNLELASYPALSDEHKVSAAWLVEHSGFSKGHSRGRAAISGKHSLAIVNRGGASALEIMALKEEIEHRVEKTWGIRLQPEPVFVGF